MIYSDWTQITFAGSGSTKTTLWNVPDLTVDIWETGVVLVYGSSRGPLPVYYINPNTGIVINFIRVGNILPGSILLQSASTSASGKYRYVLIPGGIAASAHRQGIDLRDYEEVAKAFNIPK